MTCRTLLLLAILVLLPLGCARPNQANIALRKENQDLEERIEQFAREAEQLRSQLRALESDLPTIETLPQDRLDELFTVAGIKLGRLTRRADDNSGLLVYVLPIDGQGDNLKAAGAMVVEAFNLNAENGVRVGQWEFPLPEVKPLWQTGSLFAGYRLECPWEATEGEGGEPPPADLPLVVKVTFTDGLTGRTFTAKQDVE